ncbi:hypothetical protein [Streptomyces venezuelae]|uniref:hypothetical protein n=1 Tax=Streptomyces venezuelae TaxID=54571 RepID=UPI00342BB899
MDNSLSSYVMNILMTVFGMALAAGAFMFWSRKQWGALVTWLLGGSIVGYTIYDNAAAIELISAIGTKIAGLFG